MTHREVVSQHAGWQLLCAIAFCTAVAGGQTPPAWREGKAMARFAITISMPHSEYATGESIPLTATVKNLSDAVAAVPASSAPSPFVYQIKSLEARNPSLVLSESRQLEMTSPGTPQTPAYVAL